jgi:hypothetical protein
MNKRVIILFSLALLLYGLYQWWERSRNPIFQAALLHIDIENLTGIDIDPPGEEETFSLLPIDGRWIASRELINVEANATAVARLIQALNALRTHDLANQQFKAWPRYGVADDQPTLLVSFRYADGRTEAIRIGLFPQALPHPDSLVYARLQGQQDVYALRARQLAGLPMYLADFRDALYVALPTPPPAAFRLLGPDTLKCFRNLEGGWRCNGLAADSAALDRHFSSMTRLSGAVFANDFDELQAGRFPRRQLVVYPGNAIDSVVLTCYIDSLRLWPYVLHSSQHPSRWLSSDAAGLYHQVFGALDSLLSPLRSSLNTQKKQ